MQNKISSIFLAFICIINFAGCNKQPKLDSDIDISSVDEVSSENMSSDSTIGEVIIFDEKELVDDLNYKLLNIVNERNYFNAYDESLYQTGEYSYRAYQDSKFTNYIHVIVSPDDKEPSIYNFVKTGGVLKYIGRDMTSYFDVVENKKIAEGMFTYEETFKPAYGDNGINYEVIADSIKSDYDNEENIAGSQGSKVYFRNQFSWDMSRGNGTYYYEMAAYAGIFIDVLILADNGNIYEDSIYLYNTYDSEYILNINASTPDELNNWELGMNRHSLQEFGFTELHQRMVDHTIETSPYNFDLKISASY